ncbi:hypothetical protein PF005_g30462 [Phytophthora fragariae]|uniref:RxLR effector protein n=1 Tax=Phytophthora fragariae TaxID=53985 RepID=A0A6A3VBD3_9STRA|nr:hypothetical protein PF005_g30462 [Phytophthora fragariae]
MALIVQLVLQLVRLRHVLLLLHAPAARVCPQERVVQPDHLAGVRRPLQVC